MPQKLICQTETYQKTAKSSLKPVKTEHFGSQTEFDEMWNGNGAILKRKIIGSKVTTQNLCLYIAVYDEHAPYIIDDFYPSTR